MSCPFSRLLDIFLPDPSLLPTLVDRYHEESTSSLQFAEKRIPNLGLQFSFEAGSAAGPLQSVSDTGHYVPHTRRKKRDNVSKAAVTRYAREELPQQNPGRALPTPSVVVGYY